MVVSNTDWGQIGRPGVASAGTKSLIGAMTVFKAASEYRPSGDLQPLYQNYLQVCELGVWTEAPANVRKELEFPFRGR
jgi:hypothetical protein